MTGTRFSKIAVLIHDSVPAILLNIYAKIDTSYSCGFVGIKLSNFD
jgi:hypothetical protein